MLYRYVVVVASHRPLSLIGFIKKASQNADDIEGFTKRIKALTDMLSDATSGGATLSKSMEERIKRMTTSVLFFSIITACADMLNFSKWEDSANELKSITSQTYVARVVKRDINARTIATQLNNLDWSIRTFNVSARTDDYSQCSNRTR